MLVLGPRLSPPGTGRGGPSFRRFLHVHTAQSGRQCLKIDGEDAEGLSPGL